MKINTSRLLFAFGILLFLSSCKTNKPYPKKIELEHSFKSGKTYHFEIQRGMKNAENPEYEKYVNKTQVTMKVLNEYNGNIECSWVYGNTYMSGIKTELLDEQTQKAMNIYKGFELRFVLSKKGELLGITNYEACKKQIEQLFLKDLAAIDFNSKNGKTVLNTMKNTYSTELKMINTYFPEITYYFSIFGTSLKTDSTHYSLTEIANPFGDKTFKGISTVKVENINDNIAFISNNTTIPPIELKSVMRSSFKEMAKISGKPLDESEIPTINISSNSTFVYYYKKKILIEMYREKIIEENGVKTIQTLKVILKNPF